MTTRRTGTHLTLAATVGRTKLRLTVRGATTGRLRTCARRVAFLMASALVFHGAAPLLLHTLAGHLPA